MIPNVFPRKRRQLDDVPAALVVMFRLGVQPFLISWMRLDPAEEARSIKASLLIVWGRHDLQIAEADYQAPGSEPFLLPLSCSLPYAPQRL
jgi:hypothetical protein